MMEMPFGAIVEKYLENMAFARIAVTVITVEDVLEKNKTKRGNAHITDHSTLFRLVQASEISFPMPIVSEVDFVNWWRLL